MSRGAGGNTNCTSSPSTRVGEIVIQQRFGVEEILLRIAREVLVLAERLGLRDKPLSHEAHTFGSAIALPFGRTATERPPPRIFPGGTPHVLAADFNGDGALDLAAALEDSGIAALLRDGGGHRRHRNRMVTEMIVSKSAGRSRVWPTEPQRLRHFRCNVSGSRKGEL